MPKNIFISNFRKIPKGFLILMVLILATEIILGTVRPELVTNFWGRFTINEHVLIDMGREFDYLLMGDSIQKTGIEVRRVSENLLNLGLPGAKPASLYLLLKRYLKKYRPPKVIFLFVDPQDVHGAMYMILKYFVSWPEFAVLWKDLTWEERLHFFLRHWVSFDERKVSAPARQVYTGPNSVFIEDMKRNHGYMPLPRENDRIKDDFFATTGARPEKTIVTDKRDFIYIDKIIKLARSHDIKVVFLGNILPKELYDIAETTGFNLQWLAFLDVIKKGYPDIEIVNEPILYLENRYFADESHLNKEGRAIYMEYFKNQVFIPFTRQMEAAK